MLKKPNTTGRAFEYICCKMASESSVRYENSVDYTSNAIDDQVRDKEKFDSLDLDMKEYYSRQSRKLLDWIIPREFENGIPLTINRNKDSEGKKKSNPTDIEIISKKKQVNISLKHNNKSVKHQRTPNIFDQLGEDNDIEERKYREKIKSISDFFHSHVKANFSSVSTFKELKNLDNDIISNTLYEPTLSEYCNVLRRFSKREKLVQNFFQFITGKLDYYLVQMNSNNLKITEYQKIPLPKSFEIVKINASTQIIKFNNNYEYKFRLHTASSRISKCSARSGCDMKIDTTLVSSPPIPEFEL